MNRLERMKEIVKANPDFGKRVGYKMCVVDEFHDIQELEKENTELKAQIEKMKCCGNCRWEQPCSFCDDCKRLEGQIFSDILTSDNWELKEIEK